MQVWNLLITKGLEKIGFTESSIDDCVFFHDNMIFILYFNGRIFASPSSEAINQAIRDIRNKFNIEDQGTLEYYIVINIEAIRNGKLKLSRLHLIDHIYQAVNMLRRASPSSMPENLSLIIYDDIAAPPFDNWFHYRSVVTKLNLLETITRRDIFYTLIRWPASTRTRIRCTASPLTILGATYTGRGMAD